jgi:tetratricopeptide (TPR) repeat protein
MREAAMLWSDMRLALALLIGLAPALAYADDADNVGAVVPSAPGPKMVPMFTVMASRIMAPLPHLPDAFLAVHPEPIVNASFRICLDTEGHVTDVTPKMSTGDATADKSIATQIRNTWLYKAQPLPVCFVQPFRFQIAGAPPSTPPPSTRTNIGVSVDPALAKPVGAAWLGYALTLVIQQTAAKKGDTAFDPFGAEVAARTAAVGIWKESRKDEHDAYLDALTAVFDAGFMNEYVIVYSVAPGWRLSADRLRALRLDAFLAWRQQTIAGHRVETHARAGIASVVAPGAGMLDGVVFHTLADCAVGAELRSRLASWEASPQVEAPLHVANRDQLVEILLTESLRAPLLARGVVWVAPALARAYTYAASCAVEGHELGVAEVLLRKLIKLAPRDDFGPTELAHVLVATQRYDDAVAIIDQTLATTRDRCHQAILWRKRGYIFFERKSWSEARAAYLKSLELDPGNASAVGEIRLIDRLHGLGPAPTGPIGSETHPVSASSGCRDTAHP